jgi:DNA-binding LacI/PurR family transcriptional regulator
MPCSGISEQTRKKVLELCKDHNINVDAKLRNQGVILGIYETSYISHYFFARITATLIDRFNKHNIDLQIRSTNEDHKNKRNSEYILNKELQPSTVGIIIADQLISEKEVLKIATKGHKVVLIDRYLEHPNICCVLIDNEYAVYKLTEHFITDGHEKIGIIISSRSWDSHNRMLAGYKSALTKHNLEYNERYIFEIGDEHLAMVNGNEVNYNRYMKQLDKSIITGKNRPTAIITAQDLMGIQLMEVAKTKGLNIPDDLAVTGYDNTVAGKLSNPNLTTVDIPFEEIADKAAEQIVSSLSAKACKQKQIIKVKPEIIFRESS